MSDHYLLMTIEWKKESTLDLVQLADHYNLQLEDFDGEFGTVLVDEENKIYSFRITEPAYNRIKSEENDDNNGPFSDPNIEPFNI